MRLALAVVAALALAPSSAFGALAYEKGGNGAHPSICVADNDGSHPHKVGTGDFPVIAPNGSAVAYEARPPTRTGDYALWISPAPGQSGAPHRLAANLRDQEQTAWSPDSTRLAAVVGPELGANRLVVIDVASGRATTIARGFIGGLSWSPDGTRIVYASAPNDRRLPFGYDLHIVAATGGAATALTHDAGSSNPVWGPRAIAFSHFVKAKRRGDGPKANLFTIAADGSGRHQLTRQTVPFLLTGLFALGFSAGGDRLLAEFGGQDTSYGETVDPATGAVRRIGPRGANYVSFGLSRDGSTILAGRGFVEPGGRHDIVTIPYGGGTPTTIVRNAFNASWNR